MKQFIKNYTFSPSSKTVTLSDFSTVLLNRLLLITDVTNGTIIYQFNGNGLGASVTGNTVTLSYNTNVAGFNSGDSLQIVYDSATGDPTYDTPVLPNNAAKETGGNLATIAGAISSGKMNVNLAAGSSTIGNVEITDGTNTANVAPNNSTATGGAGNFLEIGGTGYTTSTLTLNSTTQNTSWFDMLNYPWLSIEVLTNASAATLSFQTSGDSSQTNVIGLALGSVSNTANTTTISTATTGAQQFYGSRGGRYFRISSNLSGASTATLVITFYTTPGALATSATQTSQLGTWTVGSNAATGSAAPSSAFYIGQQGASGNLVGLQGPIYAGDAHTGSAILSAEGYVYNGSTFDRQRSASAASGSTGTGLLGAGILGQYNSSAPTISSGNYNVAQLDSSGNLKVNIAAGSSGGTQYTNGSSQATPSGTVALGYDGANVRALKTDTNGGLAIAASATGGYTPGKLISAATTNATSVKASAGTLGKLSVGNNSATIYYLKLYDKASAPTVGTDTPVATYIIPANSNGAGSNIPLPPVGEKYSNGIAFAITGGIADSDTTVCAANAVVVSYAYI